MTRKFRKLNFSPMAFPPHDAVYLFLDLPFHATRREYIRKWKQVIAEARQAGKIGRIFAKIPAWAAPEAKPLPPMYRITIKHAALLAPNANFRNRKRIRTRNPSTNNEEQPNNR